jgi:hypothetical protein
MTRKPAPCLHLGSLPSGIPICLPRGGEGTADSACPRLLWLARGYQEISLYAGSVRNSTKSPSPVVRCAISLLAGS